MGHPFDGGARLEVALDDRAVSGRRIAARSAAHGRPGPVSAAMRRRRFRIPLSPSTFRTSSVMPRTAIMRWRLDAVVSAGL
jgi:hypothetical protein